MNKKKKWGIILGVIALLIALGITFKWDIYVRYYNLVNNHFHVGDKMYAIERSGPFEKKSVAIWHVIRPIDRNSKLPTYAVFYSRVISGQNLVKNKSAYFGNYLGREILDLKADNGRIVNFNFYAFEPVNNVIEGPDFKDYKMPENYEWADSNLYVAANDVTDNEISRFVKK